MSENQKTKKKNFKEVKEKPKKIIYVQKKGDELKKKRDSRNSDKDVDPNKKYSKNVLLAMYTPDFFNFFEVINLSQEYPFCFSVKKIPPTLLFKSNKNTKKAILNCKKNFNDRFKPKTILNKKEKYSRNDHEEKVPEWYTHDEKDMKDVTEEVNNWKADLEKEEEMITEEIKDSFKTKEYSKIDELMERKFKNTENYFELEADQSEEEVKIQEENENEEEPEWGDVNVQDLRDFQIKETPLNSWSNQIQSIIQKPKKSMEHQEEIKIERKITNDPILGEWGNISNLEGKVKAMPNSGKDNNITKHLGINADHFQMRKGSETNSQKLNALNTNSPHNITSKSKPPGIEKQPPKEAKPKIPMEKLLSRIFPPMAKYNQFLIFSIFTNKFNFESLVEAWYYKDPYDQIQGPFSSENMDIWNTQGYFPSSLNISWFQPQQFVCLEKFRNSPETIYKLAQIYSSKVIKISDTVIDEYIESEKRSSVEHPKINQNVEFSTNFVSSPRKSEANHFNIQLNVNQNVFNNQINTHSADKNSFENILSMANSYKGQSPFMKEENFDFGQLPNAKEQHSFPQKTPISFENENTKNPEKEVESNDLFSSLSKIKTFDEGQGDLTTNDIKKILGIGVKGNPLSQFTAMNATQRPAQPQKQTQKYSSNEKSNQKSQITTDEFPSLSDFSSSNKKGK